VKSFARGARAYDDDNTAVTRPDEHPSRTSRAAELARDLAFREAHPNGADLVELRALLRKRLTWLKARFAEVLADHEVYYALFPIVVYVDELVNAVTRGAIARWEPLQSELYEVDNGGEVFYAILDDRLRQEETSPIVFEVFYFCLKDGFAGMYQGDPRKIDEYKARLVERTRLKPTRDEAPPKDAAPVELVDFPWRYYAIAGASIGASYLLFTVFAWMST
jgi:type IV/VI secretion system ImpK/VasF family protein